MSCRCGGATNPFPAMAMALSVEISSGRDYKVKHLSQANFARLELSLAEVEMPGLMASHAEFGPAQPFKGSPLPDLGLHPDRRPRRRSHRARLGRPLRRNGDALEEYWWCTERCLDWGEGGGPDLIVGDATLLIHDGVNAVEEFGKILQMCARPMRHICGPPLVVPLAP
ncbi:hypothetical protein QYE76_064539 [Lolium multiflorum]|uniref:Uncharacterized protein n=1 Tax=Lolium multiflorum TaxID=4521 RepID=A0AAD8S7K7_LOLMU|nr:hypothetical protein QYE76_064539 [Lolium multiflorum]